MRVRGMGLGVFFAAAVAVLVHGQSQPPRPQFLTGVELLQLDVTVLDDKREPVRGLTAEDFTVEDDGVAAPIRAFTPVELAARNASAEPVWANDAPADVATNQVGNSDGRLVVILLDRTIPLHQPTITARKIATAAVEALGPNDLAAVVSTSNGAVQNLTADRTRLLKAINTGDPSTGIAPEQIVSTFGALDPLQDGRCLCGLCVLETLTRVAEAVEYTPRRQKLLLFIGNSVIWQSTRSVAATGADVGCGIRLEDARKALFAAVDRAHLTVHAIDPQGLANPGTLLRAGVSGTGQGGTVQGGRLQQQQKDTNDAMTAQQSLEVLPARTGGRTLVGRNNPEEVVPAIFRESESYYVIGIERAPSERPERLRSIEVKVRRKGLKAYAQRKYRAPAAIAGAAAPAPATPSIDDALGQVLPDARVPLSLGVTAFARPDGGAIVRTGIDAGGFARSDGAAVPLDVAVLAVDGTGRPVASAKQTSTISRGGADTAQEVYLSSHLELGPGDYGIRVAVSDPASGRTASVFSDLTVPQFATAPLSLSDLNVEHASSAQPTPTATLRRSFRQTDVVRAVLQIYQGTLRTDPIAPVAVRVQILDAKGKAVRDQTLPFGEATFTNRRADCVITLPLANLPAGSYLLKLDASLARQSSTRAMRFSVQ